MSETQKMKCTKENVEALLQNLCDAPGGPVEELRRQGIKGNPGECFSCPITRYLEAHFAVAFSVGAHAAYFYQFEMVPLPLRVMDFVRDFDSNKYLDLVEDEAT